MLNILNQQEKKEKSVQSESNKDTSKSADVKIETIYASKKPKKFFKNKLNKNKVHKLSKKGDKNELGDDPFPEVAPIPKHRLKKYSRGKGLSVEAKKKIKTNLRKKKILNKDEKIKTGIEQAARAELLLLEPHGYVIQVFERNKKIKFLHNIIIIILLK